MRWFLVFFVVKKIELLIPGHQYIHCASLTKQCPPEWWHQDTFATLCIDYVYVYCRWYDIWCMNHYMYIHMHPEGLSIYCNKYHEYLRAMEMHFRTTWTFFTFQFGQSMRRIVSWHKVRLIVKGICKWRRVTRKWYCNLFWRNISWAQKRTEKKTQLSLCFGKGVLIPQKVPSNAGATIKMVNSICSQITTG